MKKAVRFLLAAFLLAVFLTGCDQPGNTSDTRKKLASPSDLNDKRVGVLLGSVHDAFASKKYPKATVEISSKSHPFYTGEDRMLDKTGRVERFKQRAAKKK